MIRDTVLLLKVQVLSFFGINRLIHTGTRREKLRMALLGVGMLAVVLVIAAYSFGVGYGLCYIGLSDALPPLMLLIATLITLITAVVKCNGVLFGYSDYDMVASLPVSRASIIASRLLSIYFMSLLFTLVAMLPAMIVYGAKVAAPPVAWALLALSLLLTPLLPIAVAVVAGALIMGFSSRFRHRNLLAIVLTFAVVLGIMGLSFTLQNVQEAQLYAIGAMISAGIERFYPLAALFSRAVTAGDWAAFGLFALISLGAMALIVALLERFYSRINSMLSARHARGNYRLGALKMGSPGRALFGRELRRLFTCAVYATNTLIGALLMIAMGVVVCALGEGKLEAVLELTGAGALFGHCAPILCALMVTMSSTTACAISLDGKTRWIAYAAPVTARQIFNSKIQVNLAVLCPSILIAGALIAVGLKTSPLDTLLLFAMPAAYACFVAVSGLLFNLKFPKYDWNSEYEVVKRGASMVATMGTSFAVAAAPIVLCVFWIAHVQAIVGATTIAVFAVSGLLYARLLKKKLYV